MLISIFASIGSQNLWDELILKNEIKFLRKKYNNPKFIVFSYDIKNPFYVSLDIEYKEYFPIWLNKSKNLIRNIKNFFIFLWVVLKSDLIVIGWWWLFFDNENWNKKNPLDLWIFRKKVFNCLFKKIYFFRVWLSIKNKKSFIKIKKIFSWKRHKIEVRDEYSKKVLEDLGLENIKKKFDPVFFDNWKLNINIKWIDLKNQENIPWGKKISIKKILKDFQIKDLENINFKNKKIWIAFRSWYLTKNVNPELEILLIKEIIEFIQKLGWKVILLPHSFHETDILSNDFRWMKLILKKTKAVKRTKSIKETYKYYSERKIDIILAQRLHSIILSQVYEIPFIWISYSRKTKEILNELK